MSELQNWIQKAVETIWKKEADRVDNKTIGATAYRVKNIIRIDIKIQEDKNGERV